MSRRKIAIAVLIVFIIALLWRRMSTYSLQPADKGSIIVYGSKTCPWCVKQEKYLTDNGIPYTFVDCRTGDCPEFVQGFPTLVVNGDIKTGYTEV
jgi:hypothetical protein